jgi:hypothetical protein
MSLRPREEREVYLRVGPRVVTVCTDTVVVTKWFRARVLHQRSDFNRVALRLRAMGLLSGSGLPFHNCSL